MLGHLLMFLVYLALSFAIALLIGKSLRKNPRTRRYKRKL